MNRIVTVMAGPAFLVLFAINAHAQPLAKSGTGTIHSGYNHDANRRGSDVLDRRLLGPQLQR